MGLFGIGCRLVSFNGVKKSPAGILVLLSTRAPVGLYFLYATVSVSYFKYIVIIVAKKSNLSNDDW